MRIEGNHLEQWAAPGDARSKLPELVRRLIHATIPARALTREDIPADDGIGKPGPDGRVEVSEGNTWVPLGVSVWEMGCGEDYRKKARDDYRELTEKPPPGIDPSQTTFVFVTPRRWAEKKVNRATWEQQHRERGEWKDVRVHDADALASWLQQAPAVAVWFAELSGRPGPLQTLEWIWTEWSRATIPASSEGLVLAGRDEQCVRLLERLREPACVQAIYGGDAREVAAFCWATMGRMPEPERSRSRERSLVVCGDSDLRRMSVEPQSLILIAQECSFETARAVAARGHHVILSDGASLRDALVLGPLDSQRAQLELLRMGYPGDPHQLVKRLRGTQPGTPGVPMAAIRRELDGRGDELAPELAPLCLLGGWTDSEQDIRVACELLGEDEVWLRDLLRRNSGEPRSPLNRAGTLDPHWRWASRRDAWVQLEARLSTDVLGRFERVFVEVFLGERETSEELRAGLLEGLALLVIESDRGRTEHERASRIVYRLLYAPRADQWAPLAGMLPTLAEVAPEPFLRRAEELETDELRQLIATAETARCLIAALEVLAWSEQHLPVATDLLVAIALAASTASATARSVEALCNIYLYWDPNTTASQAERMARLGGLAREHPELAVDVFTKLLRTRTKFERPRPIYRDWARQGAEVSRAEADEAYGQIWDRLLDLARADARRWLKLFPKLFQLAPEQRRSKALAALLELDASQLDEDGRESLRRELRSTIRLQREFHGRRWSEPELQQLEALHDRLAPADLRDALAFVFNLPPIEESQQQAQREAAERLANAYSPAELIELAGRVGSPSALGYALASLGRADERVHELLRASLATPHAGSQEFRLGLGQVLFERVGLVAWRSEAIAALPVEVKAELLRGCPPNPNTWDFMESLGPEVSQAYWLRAPARFPHARDNLGRVVRSLIRVGRVRDATRLLASARARRSGSLESELVVELLDATLGAADSDGTLGPIAEGEERSDDGFLISALFHQLRAEGDRWRDQLRRFEWLALPSLDLEHGDGPQTLYEELERNPEYFVHILSLAYVGPATTEVEKAEVDRAWTLLHYWLGFPGRRADGSVDAAKLRAWAREVRERSREAGMAGQGDQALGELLERSPEGTDGRWPHEAVRELFEELGNAPIVRDGLVVARGMRVEFIDSERELARVEKLRRDAVALRMRHPRTARALEQLAAESERTARSWSAITDQRNDLTLPITTEVRVDQALDQFEEDGHFVFDLDTLHAAVGDPSDLSSVLRRHRRVARLSDDLFVIVPPKYRQSKAPPPSWYLDQLMRRSGTAYCVGLLSAAALHGAGDQRPQVFQVLVDRPTPAMRVGAFSIEFVHRSREQPFDARRVNTQTGTMAVATPEATVFDLVEHVDCCGGHDAVVAVLEELAEDVDLARLKTTARAYPKDIVAAAAKLLDDAGHERLAHSLRSPKSGRAVGAMS